MTGDDSPIREDNPGDNTTSALNKNHKTSSFPPGLLFIAVKMVTTKRSQSFQNGAEEETKK